MLRLCLAKRVVRKCLSLVLKLKLGKKAHVSLALRCRALKKNEKTIKKHKKNKFANYSNRFV